VVQIELSPEEATILRTTLESYLSDLQMEIADTDSQEFRDQLKKRQAFLEKLLARLQG